MKKVFCDYCGKIAETTMRVWENHGYHLYKIDVCRACRDENYDLGASMESIPEAAELLWVDPLLNKNK